MSHIDNMDAHSSGTGTGLSLGSLLSITVLLFHDMLCDPLLFSSLGFICLFLGISDP